MATTRDDCQRADHTWKARSDESRLSPRTAGRNDL